ncbi:MAG: glycosyltransferase family 39 protein [bacterium]
MLFGFYLRYNGITHEASYWNDESHAATYARAIVQTGKPIDATGYNTGLYQIGLYTVTAVSFWLLGITEYAGRLPSVLIGILLIPLIFYVGRKMISTGAALIAAGLLTVSQMQLAWSTQLRPYIWMEAFTIITVFLCYQSLKDKQPILNRYLLWGCIVTGVSFLFHGTGLFNGLFVASVFLYRIIREKKYVYLWILIPAALLTVSALSLTPFLGAIFNFNTSVAHYSVFLRHHYGWLLVGAALGTVMLWKTNRSLCVLLSTGAIGIIALALFKVNDRYVRYSITAFPLLYLLLGAGVIGLVDHLVKSPAKRFTGYILFLGVLLIFPIAKGKLVFRPQIYYSINADMRENPIVDYKTAFQKIRLLAKGNKEVIIMDAIFDRVLWYMPGQKYGFLFVSPVDIPQASTITQFEKIKSIHHSGVAIVENWQSITTPELQDHIRKTLTYEFEMGTVKGNEKDPWNINVYSWGL